MYTENTYSFPFTIYSSKINKDQPKLLVIRYHN